MGILDWLICFGAGLLFVLVAMIVCGAVCGSLYGVCRGVGFLYKRWIPPMPSGLRYQLGLWAARFFMGACLTVLCGFFLWVVLTIGCGYALDMGWIADCTWCDLPSSE